MPKAANIALINAERGAVALAGVHTGQSGDLGFDFKVEAPFALAITTRPILFNISPLRHSGPRHSKSPPGLQTPSRQGGQSGRRANDH